jgi:hypothetical protein
VNTIPNGLTVGYVTSGDRTSRLIEWRSAGGPSHATTLVAPGWVIDSRLKGGVQLRPVSYLDGTQVRWLRVPATDHQVKAVLKALRSQLDKPYDWRDIIGFAIPKFFTRKWNDERAWICSELQAWAEEKAGIFKTSMSASRIAPNDAMLLNEGKGAVPIQGPIFG